MFPGTYFPVRYFAARYFPPGESGIVAQETTRQIATIVRVGGMMSR